MGNSNEYSLELQNVFMHMVDCLGKEYPCEKLTLEHFFLSVLNNKKCHANLILCNCLTHNDLMSIRNDIITILNESTQHSYGYIDGVGSYKFSNELSNIIDNAANENKFIGVNSKIGSEHVLLSILNKNSNDNSIKEIFKRKGVDYNFILNRCMSKKIDKNKEEMQIQNNPLPNFTRSKVNTKAVVGKTEYITNYTTNLNTLVKEGKIDTLVGRNKEIDLIIKVLARRKKNNVVLVGNGGVGKTSIVNGIAERLVKNDVPPILQNKEIVVLNATALVSGTHFRGMMEERVNGLFNELKTNKNYILFLDDMQQVVKSSSKDKDTDLSSMIGDILSSGEVRVIGAINFKDYRNGIESNPSLSRKLQKIVVEPNTIKESIEILKNNRHYYEEYHNVKYSDEIIEKIVELSERYVTDRSLPDSAIDVLDLSGAYTCLNNTEPSEIKDIRKKLLAITKEREVLLNQGEFEAIDNLNNEENDCKKIISNYNRKMESDSEKYRHEISISDIAASISDMTNIPINKLNTDEKKKLAKIDSILKQSIIGQDDAIDSVCRIIKRNKVGLGNKKRVLGALLMIGPSGVGKTLIAKKLAEEIFGSERDLVRIDMSEYSEKNSVAKLTGAAPGYIGFDNGGQLTEAIKNKQHCVLLLDEIEKADQEVYNLFLQLFDEGRLTDSAGQTVNFKNVIVLMTSNIGAKQASEFKKSCGFINDTESNKKSIIEKQLKKTFTPEFINRIDQIVYFNELNDEALKNVVKLEMEKFANRLNETNFNIEWDDSVIDLIHSHALKQKEYGARPIIRLIQEKLEDVITDLILENEYSEGYAFKASAEGDNINIV